MNRKNFFKPLISPLLASDRTRFQDFMWVLRDGRQVTKLFIILLGIHFYSNFKNILTRTAWCLPNFYAQFLFNILMRLGVYFHNCNKCFPNLSNLGRNYHHISRSWKVPRKDFLCKLILNRLVGEQFLKRTEKLYPFIMSNLNIFNFQAMICLPSLGDTADT